MIQVRATDKPGDLPESQFGTAEGCVTKQADVLSPLCLRLCPAL
jgi:hypothetical protein